MRGLGKGKQRHGCRDHRHEGPEEDREEEEWQDRDPTGAGPHSDLDPTGRMAAGGERAA